MLYYKYVRFEICMPCLTLIKEKRQISAINHKKIKTENMDATTPATAATATTASAPPASSTPSAGTTANAAPTTEPADVHALCKDLFGKMASYLDSEMKGQFTVRPLSLSLSLFLVALSTFVCKEYQMVEVIHPSH